eukprot:Seg1495.2 transcript_id=Seg1495.2/GoldUCD/mRNA.D3Y31 product="hypothetical protein" protein_id=Seg1495.2/GoldUCD/D3Y31
MADGGENIATARRPQSSLASEASGSVDSSNATLGSEEHGRSPRTEKRMSDASSAEEKAKMPQQQQQVLPKRRPKGSLKFDQF